MDDIKKYVLVYTSVEIVIYKLDDILILLRTIKIDIKVKSYVYYIRIRFKM